MFCLAWRQERSLSPENNRNTGSSYENYNTTHKNYNKTRLAIGAEQVAALLTQGHDKDPAKLRVLDAGCGIGLHLAALRDCGFGHLTGLDASLTGLKQASETLKEDSGVELVCGDIRRMPFPDASFDAVVFSFVLHHLPHTDQTDLATVSFAVLEEARRVLAPAGQLIIITCSPEQLGAENGSLWYYKYFPQAAARLQAKFLPPVQWQKLIDKCQFSRFRQELIEKTYWTDLSLDPEGPFDQAWRNGDSVFALCQAESAELEQGLAQLRQEIESGAALEHIAAVREQVNTGKQGLILVAHK